MHYFCSGSDGCLIEYHVSALSTNEVLEQKLPLGRIEGAGTLENARACE